MPSGKVIPFHVRPPKSAPLEPSRRRRRLAQLKELFAIRAEINEQIEIIQLEFIEERISAASSEG